MAAPISLTSNYIIPTTSGISIYNKPKMYALLFLLPLTHALVASPGLLPCEPIASPKIVNYDVPELTGTNVGNLPSSYYGLSYVGFQVQKSDGTVSPVSGNQWVMAPSGSGNLTIPTPPALPTTPGTPDV